MVIEDGEEKGMNRKGSGGKEQRMFRTIADRQDKNGERGKDRETESKRKKRKRKNKE